MKALDMLRPTDKDASWIQNAHVVLWLLKDLSWCSAWHKLGLFAVIPTLFLAVKVAWDSRKNVPDFIHNCAVCLWVCANITWMTGEFFYHDGARPHARVFFAAGAVVLLVYYACCIIKRIINAHRLSISTRGV